MPRAILTIVGLLASLATLEAGATEFPARPLLHPGKKVASAPIPGNLQFKNPVEIAPFWLGIALRTGNGRGVRLGDGGSSSSATSMVFPTITAWYLPLNWMAVRLAAAYNATSIDGADEFFHTSLALRFGRLKEVRSTYSFTVEGGYRWGGTRAYLDQGPETILAHGPSAGLSVDARLYSTRTMRAVISLGAEVGSISSDAMHETQYHRAKLWALGFLELELSWPTTAIW